MKNLESFGVQELSSKEAERIDGGVLFVGLFKFYEAASEIALTSLKFVGAVLAGAPDGLEEGLQGGK
uniref:hypothetical protein n=1 Tax=uncultured Tenacibaculum sp. TaxID=174713 RepID=UPI00260B4ABA|nr:hypothetical protein [uncultured Tenacibaculum sp.]